MKTQGLHHVTAITGDIRRNLDFYIGNLGLHLTKRIVIQEEIEASLTPLVMPKPKII